MEMILRLLGSWLIELSISAGGRKEAALAVGMGRPAPCLPPCPGRVLSPGLVCPVQRAEPDTWVPGSAAAGTGPGRPGSEPCRAARQSRPLLARPRPQPLSSAPGASPALGTGARTPGVFPWPWAGPRREGRGRDTALLGRSLGWERAVPCPREHPALLGDGPQARHPGQRCTCSPQLASRPGAAALKCCEAEPPACKGFTPL